MSIVTSIRDYAEALNDNASLIESPLSWFSVTSQTLPYLLNTLKEILWYFISFQFLKDNFYHPYLSRMDNNILEFLNLNIFDLSNITLDKNNYFLEGFINSFFITLPGSIGALILFRRITLEGVNAGLAATFGNIIGSCLIMVSVIFGNPLVFYGSGFLDFLFFIPLIISCYIVARAIHIPSFRLVPANDIKNLLSIGLIHFLLTISAESTLFKHFRSLTITIYPTRFFGISNNISGLFYSFGFLFGSIIFNLIIFSIVVFLFNVTLKKFSLSRGRLMKLSEISSIVILTAHSAITFSYYGSDFLIGKSLGFISQDIGLSDTVLLPETILKDPHPNSGIHTIYPSKEFSLDPAPFDRPLDKYFRRWILLKEKSFRYRSFEQLNFQGEKHWLHKKYRHGSARFVKTPPTGKIKTTLAKGTAFLRSLDRIIEPIQEKKTQEQDPTSYFTFRAKNQFLDLESNFLKHNKEFFISNDILSTKKNYLEKKFKNLFFGQIGLLPGRFPQVRYGPLNSMEMVHKKLAFNNSLYQTLLSFDIDLFLKRQPPSQSLTTQDEHNIFLKRQILERYIATERDYFKNFNNLKNKNIYNLFFNNISDINKTLTSSNYTNINPNSLFLKDSWENSKKNYISKPPALFIKGLGNKTYKHQFKGTYEIIRQLFAVSLDCPEPGALAGNGSWEKAPYLNESEKDSFTNDSGLVITRPKNPRVLKYDQPLYTTITKNPLNLDKINNFQNNNSNYTVFSKDNLQSNDNFFDHEELSTFTQDNFHNNQDPTTKPFLESSFISPFYVTWDNNHHQLLLTERFLPRANALQFKPLIENNENKTNFYEKNNLKNLILPKSQTNPSSPDLSQSKTFEKDTSNNIISFATWPLIKLDVFQTNTANWRLPSKTFDQALASEEEKTALLNDLVERRKGLQGSYWTFSRFWRQHFRNKQPAPSFQGSPSGKKNYYKAFSFKFHNLPTNIITPTVQTEVDTYELLRECLNRSVKRGGFLWPGNQELPNINLLMNNLF